MSNTESDLVTSFTINLNSQTCRVCLESHNTTLCLLDEIEYNDLNVELWQLLENVSNVKFSWNEPHLPTQLCQSCTRRLLSAYEFIRDVERSQQTLLELCSSGDQTLEIAEEEEWSTEKEDPESVELQPSKQQFLQMDDSESIIELHEEQQEEEVADESEAPIARADNNETDLDVGTREEMSNDYIALNSNVEYTEEVEHPDPERSSQLGMRLGHSQSYIYKCANCPRIFAKNTSLARHRAAAHSQTADVAAQELAKEHGDGRGIICGHCPRIFKRQDTLRRHMIAFHPKVVATIDSQEDSTKPEPPKRTAKRRECPYCGISFPVSSLTIHIRRHTGENPYKCNECEKAFPRSQDLTLHKRQHTGERPSECKICEKKFISQNKLARHMRLHTGQRPYACELCDKSFVQSNDLKIHMRRHTGERPYTCNVCSRSFVCGSLLNVHRNQKGHFESARTGDNDGDPDPYENSRVSKRRAKDIERMRIQREKSSHPLVQPYKCGVCGNNFNSGALLTIHRNKMGHYESGNVNYGDPYEQKNRSSPPSRNHSENNIIVI